MISEIISKTGTIYYCDKDDAYYQERLKEGHYQITNWRFSQQLLCQYRTCIDVGSNNACNAIHYAERFSQVACFEPTPLMIDCWNKTVAANMVSNCKLYPVALGDVEKKAELLLHPKNHGHNYIYEYDKKVWRENQWRDGKNRARNERIPTDVVPLDKYQFNQVDFIKIDVEGYEFRVILGAQETIRRNRPLLQLEIVTDQCKNFGYWPADLIEYLRSQGYLMISKNRGVLTGSFGNRDGKLVYDNEYLTGEMDFWFIDTDKYSQLPSTRIFDNLFQGSVNS